VELDREIEEDILEAEREIHKRISIGSTRFRQKNEDGSRCIRLCDR